MPRSVTSGGILTMALLVVAAERVLRLIAPFSKLLSPNSPT
jgi:hypothetical protein